MLVLEVVEHTYILFLRQNILLTWSPLNQKGHVRFLLVRFHDVYYSLCDMLCVHIDVYLYVHSKCVHPNTISRKTQNKKIEYDGWRIKIHKHKFDFLVMKQKSWMNASKNITLYSYLFNNIVNHDIWELENDMIFLQSHFFWLCTVSATLDIQPTKFYVLPG